MANGDDNRKIPDRAREAAEMSKERGRIAATISDPEDRRQFVSRQGWLEGATNLEGKRAGYTPYVRESLKAENREVARRAQRNGRR